MNTSNEDVKPLEPSTGEGATKLVPPDQQDPAPSFAETVLAAVEAQVAPSADPVTRTPVEPTTEKVEAPKAETVPTKAEVTTDADFDPNDRDGDLDPELQSLDRTHFTRIAKGIDSLRDKLREARRESAGFRTMNEAAKAAGMGTEDVEWWTNLGLRANNGDVEAAKEIQTVLSRILPVEAPKAAAPKVDDISEKIYKDRFEKAVDDAEISETMARRLSKDLAEQTMKAAPEPAPAPSQPRSPQPQAPQNFIAAAAAQELRNIEAQYVAKIPGWAEVKAQAIAKIQAEKQARGAPLPAIQWVSDFVQKVREVQMARAKTVSAPRTSTGLRPSTTQSTSVPSTRRSLDDVKTLVAEGRIDEL